jgi:hypothetical protein
VSQAKKLGDAIRIEEVVDVNLLAHYTRLLQESDLSDPSDRFQ